MTKTITAQELSEMFGSDPEPHGLRIRIAAGEGEDRDRGYAYVGEAGHLMVAWDSGVSTAPGFGRYEEIELL